MSYTNVKQFDIFLTQWTGSFNKTYISFIILLRFCHSPMISTSGPAPSQLPKFVPWPFKTRILVQFMFYYKPTSKKLTHAIIYHLKRVTFFLTTALNSRSAHVIPNHFR